MEGTLRKAFLAARAISEARLFCRRTPLIVAHAPLFRCNLSCKYCGIWSTPTQELSTGEIRNAILEFAKAGCISWNLSGGEPLLREDIGEIIASAKGAGMAVSMTSNGILVPKRLDECSKLDLLGISIDGPRKVHDLMRGKGSFAKAIRGLRAARARGIRVSILSVISPANLAKECEGLRGIIGVAKDLQVPIAFQPLHSDHYNKLAPGNYKALAPLNANFPLALDIIRREKLENPKLIRMSKGYLDELSGKRSQKCLAANLFCLLMPDGRVSPCLPFDRTGKDGRALGFVEAFRKMPEPKGCACSFNCYAEWSSLLSLSPSSILHYVSNYV